MNHPDGTTDILVIGAGASGGAFAWRLSEAGFKVVCLEQGRWIDPSSYPAQMRDWELLGRHRWNFDPNLRGLPEDYPVNDSQSPISPLMFNAVGGSTIHWTGHSPRFHPSDFRVKTLDGVALDWPLTYDELAAYYELNDRMMGCSGIHGDPANPPREPRPMPPLPLGKDGLIMARAFDTLGWHWWPSDSYINSVPYGEGRGACNFCGPTGLGCVTGAKASTDITYWPLAIKNGVDLRTSCRVFEITTGEDGRVTGASYFDADGERQHQAARAVVVACNAIGTARLMLLSVSERHPQGLANSSGMVGKNLMFHPYAMVSGVFEEQIESYKGPMGNILMSQEFYETNPKHDFVRGYTYQLNRSSGPLSTALGGAVERIPWGQGHHEEFERRFGRQLTLAVISEDLPELCNEVTLDDRLKDGHGIPAPRIRYRVSRNTRKILDHGIRQARKVFEAAGAHTVLTNPLLRPAGWHLMGTARMGDNPEISVVDRRGGAHDADNLFVVDGSTFVTCAAVNPTTTIQALALRTADHIRESRSDLKG